MLADTLLKDIRAVGLFLVSLLLLSSVAFAHGTGRQHLHEEPVERPLQGSFEPIEFEFAATGATSDPTELFTDEEVDEGGSNVQPAIWHTTFPVDGGTVTMAILVDRWCGTQECPYRFRIEADNGLILRSHLGESYGMICQDVDSMTMNPIELLVRACGATIDLKTAR